MLDFGLLGFIHKHFGSLQAVYRNFMNLLEISLNERNLIAIFEVSSTVLNNEVGRAGNIRHVEIRSRYCS